MNFAKYRNIFNGASKNMEKEGPSLNIVIISRNLVDIFSVALHNMQLKEVGG